MNLEQRYKKDPKIVSRLVAEEYILVPIARIAHEVDSIYTLNEVGGRIWDLIDGEKNLSDIKEVIVQEFEVSAEEAETDLVEFLRKLEKVGAVRVV
jgi:hypothetical protein